MNLPILQYKPGQDEDRLVEHQMSQDEETLFAELDEASSEIDNDDLEVTYEVIVPLGAAHGLTANETIAFWTRSTFRIFEAPEYSPTTEGPEASEALLELTFRALDHGFESIQSAKGPLIPFVMANTNEGEQRLERFVAQRIEEGLIHAMAYVTKHASGLEMYAIAWDGHLTLDDNKWDAVYVEVGGASEPEGTIVCQRYKLKKGFFRKRNVLVGNPIRIEKTPSRIYRNLEPKP